MQLSIWAVQLLCEKLLIHSFSNATIFQYRYHTKRDMFFQLTIQLKFNCLCNYFTCPPSSFLQYIYRLKIINLSITRCLKGIKIGANFKITIKYQKVNWYSNKVTSGLKNQTLIKESNDLLNVHIHVIKKPTKVHGSPRLQNSAKVNNTYTCIEQNKSKYWIMYRLQKTRRLSLFNCYSSNSDAQC